MINWEKWAVVIAINEETFKLRLLGAWRSGIISDPAEVCREARATVAKLAGVLVLARLESRWECPEAGRGAAER